jgi:hypothetical protein
LLEIKHKTMSYVDIINEIQHTKDFVHNIKYANIKKRRDTLLQKKKFQLGYQPWWHILFNSSEWKFFIHKEPTIINLYTGITPYEKECF